MSLALQPTPPFRLSHALAFLRGFTPMRDEQCVADATLTKAIACRGRAVAFRVRTTGVAGQEVLAVDLFSEGSLAGVWRDVLDRVRAFLSLDDDLEPFYRLAEADPAMAPVVARWRGLHQVRFASPFEAACWAVINRRIAMPVARRMKDAIVHRVGSKIEVDGATHRAFPEASAVAALAESDLAPLLGARRARSLLAVAEAFAGVDEAWLRAGPLEEVRAWLRGIPGVGPFTSGFVLYRGLGRFDGAPQIAGRLTSAVGRLYGRALTEGDLCTILDGYGAWGGYWMLYAWASTFDTAPTRSAFPASPVNAAAE
jgi:DNA-3-methyladenine glycosylase II